ncbi:MAG: 30S ribosomal protein S15 [Bacillales bacterium]|jgi:small subunit ribosomal protein S15|nr:30S ribosomal protein S15 [Bacillales bacterium]
MLTKERIKELTIEFGGNENNTGDSGVQIALFSEQIKIITEHLKANPKDFHTRRGLQILVGKRSSLLKYLFKTNLTRYEEVISKLNLRK